MIVTVRNNNYYCVKKVLSQHDTIIGIIRGYSELQLQECEEVFYVINGKKNFKVGQSIIIPVRRV